MVAVLEIGSTSRRTTSWSARVRGSHARVVGRTQRWREPTDVSTAISRAACSGAAGHREVRREATARRYPGDCGRARG